MCNVQCTVAGRGQAGLAPHVPEDAGRAGGHDRRRAPPLRGAAARGQAR